MKIKTNGDERDLEQETLTITELLKLSDVELPEMVSVQLNGAFVGQEAYTITTVSDGDEVDFLYFMAGGSL